MGKVGYGCVCVCSIIKAVDIAFSLDTYAG